MQSLPRRLQLWPAEAAAARSESAGPSGSAKPWSPGKRLRATETLRGGSTRPRSTGRLGDAEVRRQRALSSRQHLALKPPGSVVLLLTDGSSTARAVLPSQSAALLLQPARMRLTARMENYFENMTSTETLRLDQTPFLLPELPTSSTAASGPGGAQEPCRGEQPGRREISFLPQIPKALLCPEDAVIHSAQTPVFICADTCSTASPVS